MATVSKTNPKPSKNFGTYIDIYAAHKFETQFRFKGRSKIAKIILKQLAKFAKTIYKTINFVFLFLYL